MAEQFTVGFDGQNSKMGGAVRGTDWTIVKVRSGQATKHSIAQVDTTQRAGSEAVRDRPEHRVERSNFSGVA